LCASLLHEHLQKVNGDVHAPKGCRVLDVGAGTGLVGAALAAFGYDCIDAYDISPDMLTQASDKKCYDRVIVGNADKMDNVAADAYDAVVCVGALNFGHISPAAHSQFLRVVKKGGVIAFTTRQDFLEKDSQPVQDALTADGAWKLLERRAVGNAAVKDVPHVHWCYQRPL
jgi:ubiquinone/menaquinone biosynthesis C-methylase UbiE